MIRQARIQPAESGFCELHETVASEENNLLRYFAQNYNNIHHPAQHPDVGQVILEAFNSQVSQDRQVPAVTQGRSKACGTPQYRLNCSQRQVLNECRVELAQSLHMACEMRKNSIIDHVVVASEG